MYRRNQDKCRSCGNGTGYGAEYDIDRDEYELYRYNIPPRYDGSRFGRNRECEAERSSCECDTVCQDTNTEECVCEEKTEVMPCCDGEVTLCNKDGGFTLGKLFNKMGSEELLIIALILTVAGGEDSGELLLILILLLLNG